MIGFQERGGYVKPFNPIAYHYGKLFFFFFFHGNYNLAYMK